MIYNQVEAIVEDKRGKITQVVSGREWKQLNIIERKGDSLGGGHYHKQTREFFYILRGKVLLKVGSVYSRKILTYELENNFCFEVLPQEQHYMKFIEDTTLVVLYSCVFDKDNNDTFVNLTLPPLKEIFNETK
jgi:mannose-6-phosphate isomerase-like protein (cupin superfamily)